MGMENRPPAPAEMEAMKRLLEEAMAAGAMGLSSGLIYPPGVFAATRNHRAGAVAGEHSGIYASHIRNEATAYWTP